MIGGPRDHYGQFCGFSNSPPPKRGPHSKIRIPAARPRWNATGAPAVSISLPFSSAACACSAPLFTSATCFCPARTFLTLASPYSYLRSATLRAPDWFAPGATDAARESPTTGEGEIQ
ncbi:Hypothetical predicted protein, partial [Olea europaea subsp. europaea]